MNVPFDIIAEVSAVYEGSDGEATKALYERLGRFGRKGKVALNLFRAQKNSERAKVYRGGGYRAQAYKRKQWAMDNLIKILVAHCGLMSASADGAFALGIAWGWGKDETAIGYTAVLYVDLPGIGQVSFHTGSRGQGPEYAADWDSAKGKSPERIVRFCAEVLAGAEGAEGRAA